MLLWSIPHHWIDTVRGASGFMLSYLERFGFESFETLCSVVEKDSSPSTCHLTLSTQFMVVKCFFNLIPSRKHNLRPHCYKLQLSKWRLFHAPLKRGSHNYQAGQMIGIHYNGLLSNLGKRNRFLSSWAPNGASHLQWNPDFLNPHFFEPQHDNSNQKSFLSLQQNTAILPEQIFVSLGGSKKSGSHCIHLFQPAKPNRTLN